MVKLKRIYEETEPDDGYRILVDRLWPRGMSKEKAHLDLWLKDVAPSDELRKWFHQIDPDWREFKKKYMQELTKKEEELNLLKDKTKENEVVTLLFAASDKEHNNAVVLKEVLEK